MLKTIDLIDEFKMDGRFYPHAPTHSVQKRGKAFVFDCFHGFYMGWL